MTNNLHVTLTPAPTPRDLDVDQTGKANEVNRNSNAQDIVWQLTGNAATGSFVPIGTNGGFEWMPPVPPADIFGAPELRAGGKQLKVSDTNNSPSTTGTFKYMLRAEVDGTVYSTVAAVTRGNVTTTNPVIINR